MKKLIKTAKQQFEERLDQYGLWSEWESQNSCGRIGRVLENDNIVILFHEDDDDKFSEYFYPPFAELRKDDRFFKECLNDYVCHSDETFVYKMVYWLVYGKTECPLFPLDVYFPANHLMYPESHDFSDLYEEVPDVRVVTAKEQWENDSKDAKLCCNLDNGTIWKVLVEKDRLAFFRSNNEDGFYHRYDLPSMDNLRKDATFIAEYLSLVQDMHPEDLDSAVTWIKKGVYTMSDCSMMDIYQSSKTQGSYEYEDKEVELINKKDFSNDITALRNAMIAHIEELCEQGMTIDFDWMCKELHTIGFTDGCFDYMDSINSFELVKKEHWYCKFTTDNSKETYESKLSNFTINTLWSLVVALR